MLNRNMLSALAGLALAATAAAADDTAPPPEKPGGTVARNAAVQTLEKWGAKVERDDAGLDYPVIGITFPVGAGDDDLALASGCTALRRLRAPGAYGVTDAGLRRLAGLSALTEVELDAADIDDDGLAHLAGLTRLRELDLELTEIHGPGLRHLSAMRHLERLNLSFTAIGDDQLAPLASLTELAALDLTCTDVTDAGLTHLRGLKKLKELDLTDLKVTAAGVAALQKALARMHHPSLTRRIRREWTTRSTQARECGAGPGASDKAPEMKGKKIPPTPPARRRAAGRDENE